MIDTATRPLDFAAARRAMLDSQLRTCGVNTPAVLRAMNAVPRETFVPEAAHGYCYMDRSITLADGGTLAQPVAHGKLLQEAALKSDESVLVVDNSAGYLAALAAQFGGKVDTVSVADAADGKKRGSYDVILIDGAIEDLPAALTKRLSDTGRIVAGVVRGGICSLSIGRKSGKDVAFMAVEDVPLPRLAAFDKPKGWSF